MYSTDIVICGSCHSRGKYLSPLIAYCPASSTTSSVPVDFSATITACLVNYFCCFALICRCQPSFLLGSRPPLDALVVAALILLRRILVASLLRRASPVTPLWLLVVSLCWQASTISSLFPQSSCLAFSFAACCNVAGVWLRRRWLYVSRCHSLGLSFRLCGIRLGISVRKSVQGLQFVSSLFP